MIAKSGLIKNVHFSQRHRWHKLMEGSSGIKTLFCVLHCLPKEMRNFCRSIFYNLKLPRVCLCRCHVNCRIVVNVKMQKFQNFCIRFFSMFSVLYIQTLDVHKSSKNISFSPKKPQKKHRFPMENSLNSC